MPRKKRQLRWSVEHRLSFIDWRLFWENRMNRSDLMSRFRVSVNQASTDLNRYIRAAPRNMVYDKSARTYVPGPSFRPKFHDPAADQYLRMLDLVSSGIVEQSDSWFGKLPNYDAVPALKRSVDTKILKCVVNAIHSKYAIEIQYQSLTTPEPQWRWVCPHAIGSDGNRWHARSWCESSHSFKDFNLARILETRETRRSEINPENDLEWHETVILEIGPHPDMSETQKQVIERDYGMQHGRVQMAVRRAFVYYVLKGLNLSGDTRNQRPGEQQIVLLNPSIVEDYLHSEDARETA